MMDKKIKLNPLCRIKVGEYTSNNLIVELLLEGKKKNVKSFEFLKIANFIKENKEINNLITFLVNEFKMSNAEAKSLIEKYIENKIIVYEDYSITNYASIEHWIKRGWLEALFFHLKTKNLNYMDDNQKERGKILHKSLEEKIEKFGIPDIYEYKSGKKRLLFLKLHLCQMYHLKKHFSLDELTDLSMMKK
ncbi:hypothetical protein M4K86_04435 [Staphylococcus equorum]|uniref:hypothetical protein n=1 Tax=Staphylococcus equorum TaxID=246432 RepID=UPI002404F7A8|nr:hypothetical protein [Staphylococcus equorum]MDG0837193.1 hypothetical protein [Staphylococcus equorum]